MGYKKLPFKVVWLEMPDIEPTLKSLGAAPTGKKPDGSDLYTVPALHDSSTNRIVSDSIRIAEYLDETYPNTPVLIPPELKAAVHLFDSWWVENVRTKLMPLVIFRTSEEVGLETRTKQWFTQTREKQFGGKLKDLAPVGSEKRAEMWKVVRGNLDKLDGIWSKNEGAGKFWFGERLTYADIVVTGNLMWARALIPDDFQLQIGSQEVNGGRWKDLVQTVEQYYDATV